MKLFHVKISILCLSCIFYSLSIAAQPPQHITMNLPESVLRTSLKKVLPLSFDTASNTLKGTITIVEISNLSLKDQLLLCRLRLRADDLYVETKISSQVLKLKIGTIDTYFDSAIRLRFDPVKQTLYIRPTLKDLKSSHKTGKKDIGSTLLTLLNGKEFPITIQELEPLISIAKNKEVKIQLQIVDIRALKNSLQLSLTPLITTEKLRNRKRQSQPK